MWTERNFTFEWMPSMAATTVCFTSICMLILLKIILKLFRTVDEYYEWEIGILLSLFSVGIMWMQNVIEVIMNSVIERQRLTLASLSIPFKRLAMNRWLSLENNRKQLQIVCVCVSVNFFFRRKPSAARQLRRKWNENTRSKYWFAGKSIKTGPNSLYYKGKQWIR